MKPFFYILLLTFTLGCGQAQAQYMSRFAGTYLPMGGGGDTADGILAIYAKMDAPEDVCMDKAGNLYVSLVDGWAKARVKKIIPSGIITTVAGSGSATSIADGVPATAAYIYGGHAGICIDTAGDLLITEQTRVRRVNHITGIITTVAGTMTKGYSGDGGAATAAQLNQPSDVDADAANNLYIADAQNHRIRRVDAVTGIITTMAGDGTATFGGDGGAATAARLALPYGVLVDEPTGDLYIGDDNNRRVRMIKAATGIITTVAGNGTIGGGGDGGPATAAQLFHAGRLAKHKDTIYITGNFNFKIRRVNLATGNIYHCAGIPTGGFGDTVTTDPATANYIDSWGACTDECGNLYVADRRGIVCVISPTLPFEVCKDITLGTPAAVEVGHVHVSPNPNNGTFTLNILSPANAPATITITNTIGAKVKELHTTTNKQQEIKLDVPPGLYFIHVATDGGRYVERVVVE